MSSRANRDGFGVERLCAIGRCGVGYDNGIRVNCVCPGITDTPMFRFHINQTDAPGQTLKSRIDRVPLKRSLEPREIADAVLYLSGTGSSGITGTTLLVEQASLRRGVVEQPALIHLFESRIPIKDSLLTQLTKANTIASAG